MAKIIRLTESDLQRIVKRVLNEAYTTLMPAVDIYIDNQYYIFNSIDKMGTGCKFKGAPRGSSDPKETIELMFDCRAKTLNTVVDTRIATPKDFTTRVSPEAINRLSDACECRKAAYTQRPQSYDI